MQSDDFVSKIRKYKENREFDPSPEHSTDIETRYNQCFFIDGLNYLRESGHSILEYIESEYGDYQDRRRIDELSKMKI